MQCAQGCAFCLVDSPRVRQRFVLDDGENGERPPGSICREADMSTGWTTPGLRARPQQQVPEVNESTNAMSNVATSPKQKHREPELLTVRAGQTASCLLHMISDTGGPLK
jgi:hypothetical protein